MDSADLTLPGRRTASRDVAGMPGPAGERTGADLVRFLDAMPAAFCFLDTSWRFRYANTGAEQLIGRSRQDLLGRSLWEVLPGAADQLLRPGVGVAEAPGGVEEAERRRHGVQEADQVGAGALPRRTGHARDVA